MAVVSVTVTVTAGSAAATDSAVVLGGLDGPIGWAVDRAAAGAGTAGEALLTVPLAAAGFVATTVANAFVLAVGAAMVVAVFVAGLT